MRYVFPAFLLVFSALGLWAGIYRGIIHKEIRRFSMFREGELLTGRAAVREGWKYVAIALAVPLCFLLAIVWIARSW
jgi:hypothetical protein